jgi:DNA invertase Pin-like site-specific DNA recombinase
MEFRTSSVRKTRKLADGTINEYMSSCTYKVKNGVDDHRANNKRPCKITQDQRAQMCTRYAQNVKIAQIANDFGVSYSSVYKIIQAEKNADVK